MKKIIFLVGVLFLISFINAQDYKKIADSTNKTISIKDCSGIWNGFQCFLGVDLIGTTDVASLTLLTPKHNIVWGTGNQRVAEIEIDNKNEYLNALSKIDFYNVKLNMTKVSKLYSYRYKVYKNITEDIIGCANKDQKPGEDCKQEKLGTREVQVEDWLELDIDKPLPKGKMVIGVYYSDVKNDETIEWIPEFYNTRINEWADFIGATRLENSSDVASSYYLSTTSRRGGQTFTACNQTPGNWNFVGVSLNIKKVGDTGTINIWLETTNGTIPNGTILTMNISNGNNLPTGYQWVNFTMAPYPLICGRRYAVVINYTTANSLYYQCTGNYGSYKAGDGIDTGGGSWAPIANGVDNLFEVYGTALSFPQISIDPSTTSSGFINGNQTFLNITVSNHLTANYSVNGVSYAFSNNNSIYFWGNTTLVLDVNNTVNASAFDVANANRSDNRYYYYLGNGTVWVNITGMKSSEAVLTSFDLNYTVRCLTHACRDFNYTIIKSPLGCTLITGVETNLTMGNLSINQEYSLSNSYSCATSGTFNFTLIGGDKYNSSGVTKSITITTGGSGGGAYTCDIRSSAERIDKDRIGIVIAVLGSNGEPEEHDLTSECFDSNAYELDPIDPLEITYMGVGQYFARYDNTGSGFCYIKDAEGVCGFNKAIWNSGYIDNSTISPGQSLTGMVCREITLFGYNDLGNRRLVCTVNG